MGVRGVCGAAFGKKGRRGRRIVLSRHEVPLADADQSSARTTAGAVEALNFRHARGV